MLIKRPFLVCSLLLQSNLMYGWKLYSYRTLLDAAQTMVSLQLGIFNYEEVRGRLLSLYHGTLHQMMVAQLFANLAGSELQPSSRCFPHRLLHRLYDICCVEPLHLGYPGGIQSGAGTSSGKL